MLLTKLYIGIYLLLAIVYIKESNALVEPLDHLPEDLQWYLDTCLSSGNLTQQSARLVFWASINQYTSRFIASKPELSPQEAHYFESNLEDAFAVLFPHVPRHEGERVKRQTPPRRVRREIRAMTVDERRRYFAAVNAMKNDRSLPPNVYDFIASYHSGDNIPRAHFGPAFPSWHRLYLYIFEYFLRLQDPTASIPYWASVLDNEMQDPTQSVIWSPGFYGNGDGAIRTGPFRNWPFINPETAFTRNVQDGELFTYDGIERILSRSRNAEILIPTAFPDSNFELQHGAPHVFVGGSMNDLNSAARDPIFFSHHSFVDEIWERFRSRQSVNPETDYPFIEDDPRFRPEQRHTATAGFVGLDGARDWTQNIGYLNVFSNFIMYDPVPECPFCADSPYLFCNTNLGRCVSRSIAEMGGRSDVIFNIDSTSGQRFRRHSPTTSLYDASLDVCPRRSLLNDVETKWFGRSEPLQGPPTNVWAYIPVRVVTKRPPEYNEFSKYSLYRQRTRAKFGFKNELLTQGLQKRFESCEKFQDTVGIITIMSHGLNYDGYAEEYVLTDNRLGVAEANGFIPVKMPTGSKPSEAIIAAFDSCGRVCKPYGKRRASGAMLTGSTFPGGIRVSYNKPKQFSPSYTDMLLNVWNVPTKSSCPTLDHDNIPVSFFCEYTDIRIWGSAKTMLSKRPNIGVQEQEYHNLAEMETFNREVTRAI